MNEWKFMELQKDNREWFGMAKEIWCRFIRDRNADGGRKQIDREIINGSEKRIDIQSTRKDIRRREFC